MLFLGAQRRKEVAEFRVDFVEASKLFKALGVDRAVEAAALMEKFRKPKV